MNAIQQISLKLKMGLDPHSEIPPERLREMWFERVVEPTSRRLRHPKYFEDNARKQGIKMHG